MQEIKFFTGTPDEITREFKVWQAQNLEFKVLEKVITMDLIVLPMPSDRSGLLSTGAPPAAMGQVMTVIYMMVTYEDLSNNPT